ncbi:MAG: hypothetical protein AAF998_09995 [Bacteroidota bacterium]
MKTSENLLMGHLREFRRKYYFNQIIRGSIGLLLITSSILFLSIAGEGLLGFSSAVRTGMIIGLSIVFLAVLGGTVVWPWSKMMNLSKPLSDMEIAELIRKHFPNVDDKLMNLLELRDRASVEESALLVAAIQSKTEELAPVPFARAINLNVNWRYARYLGIPAGLFLLLWLLRPDVLSGGATRLVNFGQEFIPPPPFAINVLNHPDELIAGQGFKLETNVDGDELPAELYLYLKKASEKEYVNYPMDKIRADEFTFEFANIKENFNYYIGNEGVDSKKFGVEVLTRPSVRNFRVVLDYPGYTGMQDDTLSDNIGDFKALRGTKVKWVMETNGSIKEAQWIGSDTADFNSGLVPGRFTFDRNVQGTEQYFISLKSKRDISNVDTVRYHIDVIQDRFPSVYVDNQEKEFVADFTMFMPLNFEISDDYGFSDLALFYRFTDSDAEGKVNAEYRRERLNVSPKELLQRKSVEVDLMSLGMEEGDRVEYFVKVWDNDFVTGPKASTSSVFRINFPSMDKKFEEVAESQDKMEQKLEEMVDDVKDIKEGMEKFQEKMLNQKRLSYDDKKELEKMLDAHKDVMEDLENIEEEFKKNKENLENNEMITEETLEKYEKLQDLIEELNNEKLNEMMEKIQEQMEKLDPKELKQMMEEAEFNEEDLEKALERTLDLLKQLEVEQKSEEIMQKLENLKEKQDMLNEKLEDTKKKDGEQMKDIGDKQEELSEKMKDIEDDIKELGDMKDDTSTPDDQKMDELQQDADDAQEQMEDAGEQIQQQDKKSGSQSQQNSSKKMQKMMDQLQSMMQQSGDEQDQQNLDDLRDLLENLLRLSFRQEDVRDEVRKLRNNDPQLLTKEIEQKQLLDDMYMVKDSLDELAKRVFQIEKFVTDESNKIVKAMNGATKAMDDKYMPRITENQHASMTSINNLANMLTDVMQQMQQQMQSKSGSMGMCKKPGGNRPNMQKLGEQQGKLNQMMQQMMQGKGMNPQKLAEMARMQEAIRKQLKEAHEKIKGENGENGMLGDMGKVMKDMKDTEDELKNKILTERTMKRQQQILSRLLDSQKSVREKNQFEKKRESRSGEEKDKVSPDQLELEDYKNRLRQELLKSNQLEYSSDFIILIEKYFKLLEKSNE